MKYLKLYNEWAETGHSGYLCHTFQPEEFPNLEGKNDKLFELFLPTEMELEHNLEDGFLSNYAWGENFVGNCGAFNDFRKNIVLLMAAINGEL